MRKRLVTIIIATILALNFVSGAFASRSTVILDVDVVVPFSFDHIQIHHCCAITMVSVGGELNEYGEVIGGKWGFVDARGNIIVEPKYDEIGCFYYGLARVAYNGKFGFINMTGDIIIPVEFDSLCPQFTGRFVGFQRDDRRGFINNAGEEVIVHNAERFGTFSWGLAWVEYDGYVGFINSIGELVVSPIFQNALTFSEGFAGVKYNGKYGFINTLADVVIPFEYDAVWSFEGGLAVVELGGRVGVINRSGEVLVPIRYEKVYPDISQMNHETIVLVRNENELFGLFDMAIGEEITLPAYNRIWPFYNGLAVVEQGGKFGLINESGQVVRPPVFDWMAVFPSEGLRDVELDGKAGFVDVAGEVVIPLEFDFVGKFSGGLAPFHRSGQEGFIDVTGEVVLVHDFDFALSFEDGLALVSLDGKFGLIDKSGNVIVSAIYDDISVFTRGISMARFEGREGYISVIGEVVLPFEFDRVTEAWLVRNSMSWVQYGGKWGLIRLPGIPGAQVWAVPELELASVEGLLLDPMFDNWMGLTSRELAAEAIVNLVEIVYGSSIYEIANEKGFDMGTTFADSDNSAVTFLKAAGISEGIDGVRFGPQGEFSRAQMVTMLGRMANVLLDVDTASFPRGAEMFSDVPEWADEFVGWAGAVGITDGLGDGRFGSNITLQNQHMGVFLYRTFQGLAAE